ncbi:MAG: hypothetical protein M3R16_11225 [Pseudomonadota bacterium]|nr:hypothetical protein [Pseudomonadota bacterium]
MSLSRLFMLLSFSAVLAAPLPSFAQMAPREYRVLLAGNSLIYTNNLPALLRAVGASQGVRLTTETYAAPSGTLSQRWHDGHVSDALEARKFDAVVLQEMGALPGCLASASQQRKAPCAASLQAHKALARQVAEKGAKLLLFTTWAKDARGQARIDRGMRILAAETKGSVFNAAGAIASLQQTQPDTRVFPDGTHPSTQASLMLALALYRDITGTTPAASDLRVTAPLLPVAAAVAGDSALETQRGLVGDGKITVVPTSLMEPLIRALPTRSGEVRPSRRGR